MHLDFVSRFFPSFLFLLLLLFLLKSQERRCNITHPSFCVLSSISTSLLSGLLSLTSSLRCFLKFSFMLGIILIQLILREMVHDSCVIRERECQEDMSVYLVQKHQTSTTTDLFQESCHDRREERASSHVSFCSGLLYSLFFLCLSSGTDSIYFLCYL